ncbi:MAG: alpha/beta fold hydrolase [Gammaproteobacteria bacterium]
MKTAENLYVCFSHGQESGPWGTKISAMADLARDRGCEVESLDYRGLDQPGDRVERLIGHCRDLDQRLVLVGSSMGGHVAATASSKLQVEGLFLIAPAFYMPGYEPLTPTPRAARISVVHGWRDDVVPVANSIRWATEHRAELHVIDGDHRLADRIFEINRLFDWLLHDLQQVG